jgi:hypothetical protein
MASKQTAQKCEESLLNDSPPREFSKKKALSRLSEEETSKQAGGKVTSGDGLLLSKGAAAPIVDRDGAGEAIICVLVRVGELNSAAPIRCLPL